MNRVKQILIVFFGACICSGWLASQTIFEAVKKGDIAALKAILEADPGLINAAGEVGRSALQEAVLAQRSDLEASIAPLDISLVIE